MPDEELDNIEKRLERLRRDAEAFQTFGSSRSQILSDEEIFEYLLEGTSRHKTLDDLRTSAYFDLSYLEFARVDMLIPILERLNVVTMENEEGQDGDTAIRLTAKGEGWLQCIRAVHAIENGVNLIVTVGFTEPIAQLEEGFLVKCVHPAWLSLLSRLHMEPDLLSKLDWRTVEEIVAAAYDREGWDVILTPRSGDQGRDIIASRRDIGSIRIFDQVKSFAPNRRVSANDVRALNGILRGNVSKGVITTTSDFAPGVRDEFADLIPNRLELRNGTDLLRWIQQVSNERTGQ